MPLPRARTSWWPSSHLWLNNMRIQKPSDLSAGLEWSRDVRRTLSDLDLGADNIAIRTSEAGGLSFPGRRN